MIWDYNWVHAEYKSSFTAALTCSVHAWAQGIFNLLYHWAQNNFEVDAESPIWEFDSHSAAHKISCLLWNQKVHYRVHKSLLAGSCS
jgi:hypothetical protein